MIYILILITIMGFVTATYVNIAGSAYKTEIAREQEYAANCALEAGMLAMTDDYLNGKVAVSSSPTYTPYAGTVGVTMTDNSSNLGRTMIATATITYRAKVYHLMRTVGKRYLNPVPNTYALLVNGSLGSNRAVITQSPINEGAVCINGDIGGAVSLNVAGDMEYTGDLSGTAIVSGRKIQNGSSVAFPSVNGSLYVVGGTVINLATLLPTFNLGSGYGIRYVVPGTTFTYSGTFSGQGTVEATKMDFNGDINYSDSTSVAGFVTTSDMTVENTASNLSGYYYCGGTFTTNGPITINGSLACSSLKLGGTLTINYDPRIWNTDSLAASLHLPGAFP